MERNNEFFIELHKTYERIADENLKLIKLYQNQVGHDNFCNTTSGELHLVSRSYNRFRDKADVLKQVVEIINND